MSMRVRVRFRYRAETGEVETFTVDAVGADASAAGHEERHDAATASVAQVVENNARIEEVTSLGRELASEDLEVPVDQTEEEGGRRREGPIHG